MDETSLDILVITLQKKTSLERARTMQRNFVAWYLNGSRGGEMKDAALAAFVSPDKKDWRFSLVKMDYRFEPAKDGLSACGDAQAGIMKVKEEFTPARRWSFLVGSSEKSHTAQSRLVKILSDDEQAPTLKEIEKAFDIETVTKEFFSQIPGTFSCELKKNWTGWLKMIQKSRLILMPRAWIRSTLPRSCWGRLYFSTFYRKRAGLVWAVTIIGARAQNTSCGNFSRKSILIIRIFITTFWSRFFMKPCGLTEAMSMVITAGSTVKSLS